jgi:DNA-binding MarR family transcriptional regulator
MSARAAAFLRLSGAVRHLFHELRAVAETATPAVDGFTASHRAVLESLATHGPQTVPALARARPVARQHIQVLVNDLAQFGFVETRPNPAHKRSPLVTLTAAGTRRFDAIRHAESKLLESLRLSLAPAKLTELATDLDRLAAELSAWRTASRRPHHPSHSQTTARARVPSR